MKKILFVCLGNICRSCTAEEIMRTILHREGLDKSTIVDSAGLISYHQGEQADPRMRAHASRRGYHITHLSRPVLMSDFEEFGLDSLCLELKMRDPDLYNTIDLKNHKRDIHAIEVCRQTGRPFSELRTNSKKERPFNIIKIGLNIERELLFDRISKRTEQMIANGLIEESKTLLPYRNLNSLNTVGYKEIFAYFDGVFTIGEAIEKIKRNTRVYAKKQLTWFKRDKSIAWFNPSDVEEIFKYIDSKIR